MKHSKSLHQKIVLTAFLVTILLIMAIPLQTRINSIKIASASPETILSVEPPSIINPDLTPGDTFTVDIIVSDVIDLFSWQVAMSWTSGLIDLNSVTYGDFLPPGTKFSAPPNVNNDEGWVGFGETTIGTTGVDGSGWLATVEFQVAGTGETVLNIIDPVEISPGTFAETILQDSSWPDPLPIPFTPINGYFSNLAAGEPPVASFTFSPASPLVDETVTFDASASSDPDGTIVSWDWDFGDLASDSGEVVTHSYSAADTYTVTLTVTDDDGLTATDIQDVTVSPPGPQPPVASFTFSPASPLVDETVTFDASASSDPDGTIVSYEWDFGDLATGTGVTAAHAYAAAGTYTVTLTVTDDDGLTDAATADVTASPVSATVISVSPAEISANPGETFTISIMIADVLDFWAWDVEMKWNASLLELMSVEEGAFLKSGGLTFWASTIDQIFGEAVFGSTLVGAPAGVTGSGELATLTFSVEDIGQSFLGLSETALVNSSLVDIAHTAEDGYFYTVQTSENPVEVGGVTFDVAIESNSIVSDFTFNQTQAEISFNVTGAEGTVGFCNVTFPKDLLGGTFTVLINGAAISYTLTQNATHYFLYFTYSHSTQVIEIEGTTVATPPEALFTYSPSEPVVGDVVTFDASGSHDPDGSIVSYEWDFGDGTSETGQIVTHSFSAEGTYTVTLTVTDDSELIATTSEDVTVSPMEMIIAEVNADPDILNLFSRGKWITCYITLPEGYSASEIDVSTIHLDGVIEAKWGEVQGNILMVKFDRSEVVQYIRDDLGTTEGEVTFTITGSLGNGTSFEGHDTIRVISKGGGK